MTIRSRRRIHPVAAHVYTMPIVREVPIGAAQASGNWMPAQLGQPVLYAADSHAW
jgi:hypothetical protein